MLTIFQSLPCLDRDQAKKDSAKQLASNMELKSLAGHILTGN